MRALPPAFAAWLRRHRDPVAAAVVALAWLAFAHRQILEPWLWGIDPYTRLFHIDKTIIVVKGNAWLPLLQLLLRGVHAFSDTWLAYKLTLSVVSAAGVFFFVLVIARWLGLGVALAAALFFFLDGLWLLVGTSLYMEPLLLLFVMLAFFFHGWRGRAARVLASACLVAATFCRPEMLMASPLLVAGHLVLVSGKWRRTARFALHFLPVAVYYVAVELWLPEFAAAGVNQRLLVLRRAGELGEVILFDPASTVAAGLALLGLLLAFQRSSWLRAPERRGLKLLAAALPLYLALYSLTLPADYSFRPRFSLQFVLPLFILGAVGVEGVRRLRPRVLSPLFALLAALALFQAARSYRPSPPPAHRALPRLLAAAEGLGYPADATFVLARPDPGFTQEDRTRHIDQAALLGVTLRLAGHPVRELTCTRDDPAWRALAAAGQTPLLRVWRRDLVDKGYEAEFTGGCRFRYELRNRRKVEANVCL